jgi:hypothetical protein
MDRRSVLVLGAAVALTGCAFETGSGPMQHETRTIDRDTSESARVAIRMGAGNLTIGGGASGLMQADFLYNIPAWKPDIHYHSFAGRGDLTVEQPNSGQSHLGNLKYEWDLRLNNDVPMDLMVRFGAGEARLNLGSLNLKVIEVEMGVGKLELDLRGMPKQDYALRIRGGVGEATVYLPVSAGIYARAEGGIGEIKVRGLRQEGQHWLNDAYGSSSKPQVRVDVRGGIGSINLIAE